MSDLNSETREARKDAREQYILARTGSLEPKRIQTPEEMAKRLKASRDSIQVRAAAV